jgi:hypothetical protein
MFTGSIVWRGIIYTLLMIFGKMACGLWLIRFAVSVPKAVHTQRLKNIVSTSTNHFWGMRDAHRLDRSPAQVVELQERVLSTTGESEEDQSPSNAVQNDRNRSTSSTPDAAPADTSIPDQHISKNPLKPLSLHPAFILGFAMVSRGEIGFLISSLADSNGLFSSGGNDDIFLIITWAIVLCTIVGPVGVGLLVKRLKRLEKAKEQGGGGRDVLGVWGVR